MTLDEAIKHAEEVADYDCYNEKQFKCAEDHRQLAEWLKELKQLRAHVRWIPVSERLPKEEETVIASTEYRVYPETRYTKGYGWEWAYEAGADYWESLEGVIAWMPLPQPYKAESEE